MTLAKWLWSRIHKQNRQWTTLVLTLFNQLISSSFNFYDFFFEQVFMRLWQPANCIANLTHNNFHSLRVSSAQIYLWFFANGQNIKWFHSSIAFDFSCIFLNKFGQFWKIHKITLICLRRFTTQMRKHTIRTRISAMKQTS